MSGAALGKRPGGQRPECRPNDGQRACFYLRQGTDTPHVSRPDTSHPRLCSIPQTYYHTGTSRIRTPPPAQGGENPWIEPPQSSTPESRDCTTAQHSGRRRVECLGHARAPQHCASLAEAQARGRASWASEVQRRREERRRPAGLSERRIGPRLRRRVEQRWRR